MRNRFYMLFYLLIATILVGCGGEDYKWDTNNTSPLKDKYESRDKSLDLNLSQQEKIIQSEAQYALLSDKQAIGIVISVLYDDNKSLSYSYGCETLKSDVISSGILTYASGDKENCEKPLLTTNRMKLGSLTKTAVGRTILDIDNDSTYDFDLDDLITKHLPSSISSLGDLSGIRVKHLLFHTSGLGEIDFKANLVEEVLRRALATKKLGEAGQYYKYNNTGYVLLGEIIEHVTGSASWESEVMSRLNSALGTHDFILPERNNPNWLETTDTEWMSGKSGTLKDGNSSLAVGYLLYHGSFVSYLEDPSPDIAHSAGSLIGTVPDVSRWMRELVSNRSGLLDKSYFDKEVLETHYQDDYISHLTWNMGPGLGFEQSENAFFHLGAVSGYNCMSVYSKNEKVTITACVNGSANLIELPYDILAQMYPYRASYRTTASTSSH